jgi:hypothetical protein
VEARGRLSHPKISPFNCPRAATVAAGKRGLRLSLDQSHTILVPVHMIDSMNKIVRTSRQMLHEIGRGPTPEELAQKLGIPIEKDPQGPQDRQGAARWRTRSATRRTPISATSSGQEHHPDDRRPDQVEPARNSVLASLTPGEGPIHYGWHMRLD